MAVTFSASGTATAGGVQQTYALTHVALLEGQLSDARNNTVGTYVNETGAVLAFGNGVSYNTGGTVANSAKTLAGSGESFLGVNVLTYVDETALNANSRPGVKAAQVANVINQGAVAVYVHGSVTPATAVRVMHTTSGVRYAGQFTAAAVPTRSAVLSNARYLNAVTGSGLAILELNGPSFILTGDL
jgi:hypothetical protein